MSKYKKHFKIGVALFALSYLATFASIVVLALQPFGKNSTGIAIAIYAGSWIPHLAGFYFGGKGFLDLLREKKD